MSKANRCSYCGKFAHHNYTTCPLRNCEKMDNENVRKLKDIAILFFGFLLGVLMNFVN